MQIGQVSNNFDVQSYQPTVSKPVQPADVAPVVKVQSKDETRKIEAHENQEIMDESLKIANKNLERFDRAINREIHPVTHTVMYKIVDTRTNDVIAEFPSKKIQDMVAKMWEIAGLVFDQKI